jgi:hypothetical protein
MILKVKDKEYSFTATMKKIVGMNKKLNVKNLRDAFFKALNNVDFEFLADFLMEFADNDVQKGLSGDYNRVYDLMEAWVNEATEEEPRSYEDIYKLLAEEINDKSFFGKKMTKEELETQMNNPLADFDINQVITNTAEKVMGEVVAEEFKGYKG